MSLTLSITDNADGTGATATIAGADGAAVNVYTQRPSDTALVAWTLAGTRTGSGIVSLPLAPGYYAAYALGNVVSVPTASNVVSGFVATTGLESVEERILIAVQAGIQAMCGVSLVGLLAANVLWKKCPDENVVQYPAVFVTPQDRETLLAGTNARDDYGKPAVVQICDHSDPKDNTKNSQYLLWRERIQRRFVSQHLAGVPEAYSCKIEPAPIFDPKLPAYQYLVSAFTLRFLTREQRQV